MAGPDGAVRLHPAEDEKAPLVGAERRGGPRVGRGRRCLLGGLEASGAGGPHRADQGDDDDRRDRSRALGQDAFGRRNSGGIDEHDDLRAVRDGYLRDDRDEFYTADDHDEADRDIHDHQAGTGG
jgi:hypothetical protein